MEIDWGINLGWLEFKIDRQKTIIKIIPFIYLKLCRNDDHHNHNLYRKSRTHKIDNFTFDRQNNFKKF